MTLLEKWEKKIQFKREKTNFRDYLKEIASWYTFAFYKNNGVISNIKDESRTKVIYMKEFYEQRDDFINRGIEYNFNLPFWENFRKFKGNIPFPSLVNYVNDNNNSEYTDFSYQANNCYLSVSVAVNVENILYSFNVKHNSRNIFNSILVWDGNDNVYMCSGVIKSYNIFYSKYINNSSDIWFSSNLIGCKECIFCNGLENQSYCIKNKQLEKEEYFKLKKEILSNKNEFMEYYKNIEGKAQTINSFNSFGNYLINCENITNGYGVFNGKKGNNLVFCGSGEGFENSYDCFSSVDLLSRNYYGSISACGGDHIYSCGMTYWGSNCYYCLHMENCSFCIGCIGLKNKSYCILNKQYTKEEWYEMADKIFEQMDKDGILGDFFPGYLNPFYFNDTMAYMLDNSFTKEEVKNDGYIWRDEEIKVDIPQGIEIIETNDLHNYQGFNENGEWEIDSDIMKKIIKDEKGNIYRIVKLEYDFLMKYGLPLPELHWFDRIKLGFSF